MSKRQENAKNLFRCLGEYCMCTRVCELTPLITDLHHSGVKTMTIQCLGIKIYLGQLAALREKLENDEYRFFQDGGPRNW